jgi:DtxR family Mn-dependent transcriptional regulator
MALGQAMEDYAKAIYKLEVSSSGQPVTTDALAKHLRVTAASASAMAKKLAAHGLVTRVPYHGVRLTAQGTRIALEVVRHHRLLELFLVRELGMSWDRVHDEADVLEHVISEEIEARIAAKLGEPRWDPHGDPIPTATGDIDETPTQPVTAVEVGSSCRLSRVSVGMGSPCGSQRGSPSLAAIRASTSSEITCSSTSASSWTRSQDIPSSRTRKSSRRR